MNKKQWLGLGLVTVAAIGLAACGNRASRSDSSDAKTDLKAAIVTDTGGVDDKSFNQSAWEGLQAWGKENGLSKDNGYTYYQSNDESQYANNLNQAATDGYKLVFGIGFALRDAVESAAKDNTEINYVIIDDVIEGQKNVASAVFADNEAAYLAGVAAAKTTKTKQVGFVGGIEGAVITRFEKGFEAGVKSVDPSIKILIKVRQLLLLNMLQVQMWFIKLLVELVLEYLTKLSQSTKQEMKMKKFGYLVLTVTKLKKVNTNLKMVKNLTLFWHQA